MIDAHDQRQSMAYDQHGNLVSVTERDGSVTVHAYDDRGRRVVVGVWWVVLLMQLLIPGVGVLLGL
ncbi:hypothetical protein A7979_04645 [Rothia nasimurium]|uniref:RHS repeat protein n=1 Tax=Rothia nasimurium TaxID=85336 RepID=A0A1Y1RP76_9MICC|nr:RHS repeat domain-containing protein [Rothia nasimurium]ORC16592.1 hypothetical protein A7979_04645 [Rothia nasimurium]